MQILGREFKGAMNFSVVLVICQVHSSVEDKRHLSYNVYWVNENCMYCQCNVISVREDELRISKFTDFCLKII